MDLQLITYEFMQYVFLQIRNVQLCTRITFIREIAINQRKYPHRTHSISLPTAPLMAYSTPHNVILCDIEELST